MIPEITAILEMFKAGECTMTQALGWIEQHMANADLRDHFAGLAMGGILGGDHPITHEGNPLPTTARVAYEMADAMLKARKP